MSETMSKIVGLAVFVALIGVGIVASDDDGQFTRNTAIPLFDADDGQLGLDGSDKGQKDLDKFAEVMEEMECDPDQILVSTGDSGEWHWRCGPSLNAVLDRITSLENTVESIPVRSLPRQEQVERLLYDSGCNHEQPSWDCRDMNNAHVPNGANLSNASLVSAIFVGQSLVAANFSSTDLTGAQFSSTDLTGANFSGANLTGAEFVGVSVLTGADFTGADLTHTNFSNSDIEGAIGLP